MKHQMICMKRIMNADIYVDNDRVITPVKVDKVLNKVCRKKFIILGNLSSSN